MRYFEKTNYVDPALIVLTYIHTADIYGGSSANILLRLHNPYEASVCDLHLARNAFLQLL